MTDQPKNPASPASTATAATTADSAAASTTATATTAPRTKASAAKAPRTKATSAKATPPAIIETTALRPDAVFITGATGFIGRHLVARLLDRPGLKVFVLVRRASLARFEERLAAWNADPARIVPVVGDLAAPTLGLSPATLAELRGRIGGFFHVAGLYDMTASDVELEKVNVLGTEHAVDAARRLGAACFHHVSSIAAAGRYNGTFGEDMFEEAGTLADPYFRTKHDSERVVRLSCTIPWRIYRPSLVVGHSRTGEIDKVDGPYYFFPLIEKIAAAVPSVLALPRLAGGSLNLVPVDFVVDAIDYIAHTEGLDGKTFHLVDPEKRSVGAVLEVFMEVAGGPPLSARVPGLDTVLGPLGHLLAMGSGTLAGGFVEGGTGIPLRTLDYLGNPTTFDCRETRAALEGSGIAAPPLEDYARTLWNYWQRRLNTNTEHARRLEKAVRGRTVLITGASAGIGRATAIKLAAAGAHLLLVARDEAKLDEVRGLIERVGGTATVMPADITDMEAVDRLCEEVVERFGGVDVLVNNAGRSIRRSLRLSEGRFHDFERTMQINYFAALRLILGVLPSMRKRRRGHIVNISSIGVQVGPPRFSAYIASKAALDGFSKCAAPELIGDGIEITTVYMPLVKTEMIAPTRLYDSFSVITPAQAADLVCLAIETRSKHVGTWLGMTGQVLSSVAPGVSDVALHLAYRLFPDSSAARGEVAWGDEEPGSLAKIFARLLPGVYW